MRWKIAQWFELRWWRSYLRGKSKAEYLAWKKNYWQALLAQIADEVSLREDTSVADLGCGPAGIFIALEKQNVVAVDPLLDDYAQQLSFFSPSDYPNVQFVTSLLENFSSEEKFDLVFCLNAINHVDDLARAFDAQVACAKPHGKIVLSIDAHNRSFFKHLFRLVPGDILHPHQFDLQEYEGMLTARGCNITKRVCIKREFFFDHWLLVAEKA